jgi:endonuclease-3
VKEREERIIEVLKKLERDTRGGLYREAPVYRGPIEGQRTPFKTLVGCLISTRTRDEQTTRICHRLFSVAGSPEGLARLSVERLEGLLYGAGFYRQKAKQLRDLSRIICEMGEVPQSRATLVQLPGIGPKCANIVLGSCFGKPVIAVDTHVHRISNRMGWVETSQPEETEAALTPKVPVRWRRRVNVLLVAHGQLVCKPIGPRCSECRAQALCQRRNVRPSGLRRVKTKK